MSNSKFLVSPSIISSCIIKFQEFCELNDFDYLLFVRGLILAADSDGVHDSFFDVPKVVVDFRKSELFQNLSVEEEKFIYKLILNMLYV